MSTKISLLAPLAGLLLAASVPAAELRGVISKVDTDKKELFVEGLGRAARGMTFVFILTDDTRILFGSNAGSLADLVVGKRTLVRYEERDGKLTAIVIRPLYARPRSTDTTAAVPAGSAGGVLRLINSNDREIVVVGGSPKGGDSETTLHIPKDLKVQREDKATDFDELKEGEPLSFEAEKKDGKMLAKSLRVGPPDPNAKSAPASMPEDKKGEKVRKVLETVFQILDQMRRDRQ
jgi:Cu/Ag efflux protein CusF